MARKKTKVTNEMRQQMRELKKEGLTQKEIAAKVGVSASTVYQTLRNSTPKPKPATAAHRKAFERKIGVKPPSADLIRSFLNEKVASNPKSARQFVEWMIKDDRGALAVCSKLINGC